MTLKFKQQQRKGHTQIKKTAHPHTKTYVLHFCIAPNHLLLVCVCVHFYFLYVPKIKVFFYNLYIKIYKINTRTLTPTYTHVCLPNEVCSCCGCCLRATGQPMAYTIPLPAHTHTSSYIYACTHQQSFKSLAGVKSLGKAFLCVPVWAVLAYVNVGVCKCAEVWHFVAYCSCNKHG